jgi:hypothetical protein
MASSSPSFSYYKYSTQIILVSQDKEFGREKKEEGMAIASQKQNKYPTAIKAHRIPVLN